MIIDDFPTIYMIEKNPWVHTCANMLEHRYPNSVSWDVPLLKTCMDDFQASFDWSYR